MSRISKVIGKTLKHKELGRVEVLSQVKGSRTKVNVRVLQRAEGWDEATETYKRIRSVKPNLDVDGNKIGMTIQWRQKRHSNSQYGHEDVCHVNDLT